MTRFAAIFTWLALVGCTAAPSQELATTVDPGAEISLAPGDTASVKGARMQVRFIAVTEDSRCPRDVTCVWAGEVRVQLEMLETGKDASRVEVLEGAGTAADGYHVTLVRVEPQPTSTAPIDAKDYRATIRINKEG